MPTKPDTQTPAGLDRPDEGAPADGVRGTRVGPDTGSTQHISDSPGIDGTPDTAGSSRGPDRRTGPRTEVLLRAEGLRAAAPRRAGALARLLGRRSRRATTGATGTVNAVDLVLRKGEALALVGEPDSGRTALGLTLLGLARPASGTVCFDGHDISALSEHRARPLRSRLRTVFLPPRTTLHPGCDLGTAVSEPLSALGLLDGTPTGSLLTGSGAGDADPGPVTGTGDNPPAPDARTVRALERAGFVPAADHLHRDIASLTDEERLRAAVARAVVTEPDVLLVGEPPAEPASSERAAAMRLLSGLNRNLGLTLVLVTRDPHEARAHCDTAAVLHLGRIVEYGPAERVLTEPLHPYTQALVLAAPAASGAPSGRSGHVSVPSGPTGRAPAQLDPARPPHGCAYHPRCPVARDVCGWEARDLLALIERRLCGLHPRQADEELRQLGPLDALREPGLVTVALAPAGGGDAAATLAHLQQMRADASAREPREPLWRGVARLFEDSGRVVVEFSPAQEPVLRAVAQPPGTSKGPEEPGGEQGQGGPRGADERGQADEDAVQVACHLYPASDR